MDVIKMSTKNEKELETQIQTIQIYTQDIRMKFVIEKCAMFIRSGKDKKWKKLSCQMKEESDDCGKGKLQTLGNNGSVHHQTSGDIRKI